MVNLHITLEESVMFGKYLKSYCFLVTPLMILNFILACESSSDSDDSDIEIKTLFIDSYQNVCSRGYVRIYETCLRAKEDANGTYSSYYKISGFKYKWGHKYKIEVEVDGKHKERVDAPKYEVTLLKVLSDDEDSVGSLYEIKLQDLTYGTYPIKVEGDKYLIGEKNFECSSELDCSDLVNESTPQQDIKATFKYLGDSKIQLVSWFQQTKTYFIDSKLSVCEGLNQRSCLRVKELEKDDYTLFYDSIEGFDFAWGLTYQIKVEQTDIVDPPADGSSIKTKKIGQINYTEDSIGTEYPYTNVKLNEHTFQKTDEQGVFKFLGNEFSCAEELNCAELILGYKDQSSVDVTFRYLGRSQIELTSWSYK